MTRGQRRTIALERPPAWAIGLIVAATAAVVVLAVLAGQRGQRAADRAAAEAATAPSAEPTVSAPVMEPAVQLQPLASRSVLFVGDSWTGGYGATDPKTGGFTARVADELGLTVDTVFASGGGYAHVSPEGKTIPSLLADPPSDDPALVVFLAGINDYDQENRAVADGLAAAVGSVRESYPEAQVLVLAPMAPTVGSIGTMQRVTSALSAQSVALKVPIINTVREQWLPRAELSQLIDPAKANHPNDTGYERIAEHLEDVLRPVLPGESS